VIVFEWDEPACVIEDGHEFTMAAPLAAGADPCITCAEILLNIAQLLV
jgi:hypothetical protein